MIIFILFDVILLSSLLNNRGAVTILIMKQNSARNNATLISTQFKAVTKYIQGVSKINVETPGTV